MSAAAQLSGLDLKDGWKVIKPVVRSGRHTGGMFSHSYIASRGQDRAFLKAFDFSSAFEDEDDTLRQLSLLTASYENERDILSLCVQRRLSRVAAALASGSVNVPMMGPVEGRVYYLIFKLAQSDIRCQIDESRAADTLWCLKAARDVSLGLMQIHRELIAHQDMKPSNVLCFDDGVFRIADFGRSSRRGHAMWHDDLKVAGDRTYAPPELLYGFTHPDFGPRRIGCDFYMLGNLIAFLFTGVNMTSSILARLDPALHWTRWRGDYAMVLPYLKEAYARVLEELTPRIPTEVRGELGAVIYELCNPDLMRRGHPKGIGRNNQFSLERYVSHFDRLASLAAIRARTTR